MNNHVQVNGHKAYILILLIKTRESFSKLVSGKDKKIIILVVPYDLNTWKTFMLLTNYQYFLVFLRIRLRSCDSSVHRMARMCVISGMRKKR